MSQQCYCDVKWKIREPGKRRFWPRESWVWDLCQYRCSAQVICSCEGLQSRSHRSGFCSEKIWMFTIISLTFLWFWRGFDLSFSDLTSSTRVFKPLQSSCHHYPLAKDQLFLHVLLTSSEAGIHTRDPIYKLYDRLTTLFIEVQLQWKSLLELVRCWNEDSTFGYSSESHGVYSATQLLCKKELNTALHQWNNQKVLGPTEKQSAGVSPAVIDMKYNEQKAAILLVIGFQGRWN